MQALNLIKSHRFVAMMAVLFGAMITTTVPAFAQQDVDPTWYNPWSPTTTATATQSAKPKAAIRQHQSAVRTASSKPVAKLRVKRTATRPTQS